MMKSSGASFLFSTKFLCARVKSFCVCVIVRSFEGYKQRCKSAPLFRGRLGVSALSGVFLNTTNR